MTEPTETSSALALFEGWNWATLLTVGIAYGCALAAIFMRGYWTAFGIDPFQYGAAAEAAWAGFAAVAVSMAPIGIGAWVGHLIAMRVAQQPSKSLPGRASVIASGVGVLVACLVVGQWWLLAALGGVLLVGLMITATSAFPRRFRTPDAAIWGAIFIVYIPMSAHLTSVSRAELAVDLTKGHVVDIARSQLGIEIREPAKFVRRLGGDAVIVKPSSGTIVFIPQHDGMRIVTRPSISASAVEARTNVPGVPQKIR